MGRVQAIGDLRVGRRTRVAFISHTAAPSGAELSLLEMLGELDVDRQVILGADGPLCDRLEGVAAVTVLELPTQATDLQVGDSPRAFFGASPAATKYVATLARALARRQVDVVHTNSLKSALYGAAAARLARKPCVIHVRDRLSADYLEPGTAAAMTLWIKSNAACAIANSLATQATLRPGTRSCVIPSPIAAAARLPPRRVHADKPLVFATASRLAPWKGQLEFVRAFHEAFPDGPHEARLLGGALFGENDYVRRLHAEISRLGLESRVHLLGHQDDVQAALREADVLVHTPTIPEPFGRVIVEGMVAGAAVLARGDGGPAEIIRSDVDGILYDPARPSSLVDGLRRMTDAGLRQRLSDEARVTAASYAPAVIARQVEQVYADIVRESRRSRARRLG